MAKSIVDSHAHLGWDSFKEDRNEVIERAFASGISQIVQAGVDFNGLPECLQIAERYPNIWNGVGLHPHEAKHWDGNSADIIRDAFKHKSIVAIGECGLDYYYDHSERDVQISVFKEQVKLAKELNKPLIIHSRDAWQETFEVLKTTGKGEVRGVFHCFTGGPAQIPEIKDLDFYVSFSGILTFKSAKDIQAAAPLVADDRFLLETDSPYLAPEGKRGKRNEPSFIWITAEKLAALRGASLEETAEKASRNTRALFALAESIN
ncbi:MAG: TatD family hydrolase [Candidatus Obscuribacterales bacterium]|nr:TatD family hydrolase [Candidatus Obscuribacterales bacterium]